MVEVKVTHVVELGPTTLALVASLLKGVSTAEGAAKVEAPSERPARTTRDAGGNDPTAESAPVSGRRTRSAAPARTEETTEAVEPATRSRRSRSTNDEKPVETVRRGRPATDEPLDAAAFEALDEQGQIDEILKHVTKNVKNSKGADIQVLLGVFDDAEGKPVKKASSLKPEDYPEFYDFITRYTGGESLDDILGPEE